MNTQKTKKNPEKHPLSQPMALQYPLESRQEMYLQHLMEMTVGVLDGGFQTN